jgi:hypothetical protein
MPGLTTNAFVFAWDTHGVESIIPITQYETVDRENTMRILRGEEIVRNPLNGIIRTLILRARYNSQRHYEIYAIDCSEDLDQEFWKKQWEEYPQETAELIRERGHKIHSDRLKINQSRIT